MSAPMTAAGRGATDATSGRQAVDGKRQEPSRWQARVAGRNSGGETEAREGGRAARLNRS